MSTQTLSADSAAAQRDEFRSRALGAEFAVKILRFVLGQISERAATAQGDQQVLSKALDYIAKTSSAELAGIRDPHPDVDALQRQIDGLEHERSDWRDEATRLRAALKLVRDDLDVCASEAADHRIEFESQELCPETIEAISAALKAVRS